MSKELVKRDAITPEILGPEDRDPFTRPEPSQQEWGQMCFYCREVHLPPLGTGCPKRQSQAAMPPVYQSSITAAQRERFQEAYGYRFDRHGRLKFP